MRRLLHRQKENAANRSAATAIYLKQWSEADTLYNEVRQQNTLSAAERRQWFDVLLAGQLDDRILALQSQGIFTDPQSYILTRPRWLIVAKSTPPALSQ